MPGRTQILRQDSAGSGWELAIRRPSSFLAPYVRELMGYVERSPGLLRRREFPGPQIVVIFDLGPTLRLRDPAGRAMRFPGGFVAGLDDGYTITEHDGFQTGIQLDLTPLGARRIFGLPMSELARRIVSLEDLASRRLGQRLGELHDWDARFDVLESAFCRRLADGDDANRIIDWAVGRIEAAAGAVDMAELADELGYSQKHVIHLFHEHVGVPPKLYARIVRFDRLMRFLKTGGRGTWADLALRFGYYDQAHLVREVRQFTGVPPTEARGMLIDLAALMSEVNSVQDPARPAP